MFKYVAYDPSGEEHTIRSSRPIAFAIFLKLADGSFRAHFAKNERSARNHWGWRGENLVKAFKA